MCRTENDFGIPISAHFFHGKVFVFTKLIIFAAREKTG